jgi:hypothetical protein
MPLRKACAPVYRDVETERRTLENGLLTFPGRTMSVYDLERDESVER